MKVPILTLNAVYKGDFLRTDGDAQVGARRVRFQDHEFALALAKSDPLCCAQHIWVILAERPRFEFDSVKLSLSKLGLSPRRARIE